MTRKFENSLTVNYIRVALFMGITNGLDQYLRELEELRMLDEEQRELALFISDVDPDKYSQLYSNYLEPLLFFVSLVERINNSAPISFLNNFFNQRLSFFNNISIQTPEDVQQTSDCSPVGI